MDSWGVQSCRACLHNEELSTMYPLSVPETIRLFNECCNSNISVTSVTNDYVPKYLCRVCYQLCELWQSFKNRCQDTENKLNLIAVVDPSSSHNNGIVPKEETMEDDKLGDQLPEEEVTLGPVINWEEVAMDDDALEIPDLDSNSCDDEVKIIKRKRKSWTEVRDFASLEQAQGYLLDEGTYCIHYKDKNLVTIYYRCRHVKQKAKVQCSSRVKLVVCKKTAVVTLFRTVDDHDHHLLQETKKGIPDAMVAMDDDALEVPASDSYSSDSSDDEEKIITRKRKSWTEVRDFASLEQAQGYLLDEGTYCIHYKDKKLVTIYYRCRHVKQKAKVQCSSRVKLVVCKKTAVVTLFRTVDDHDHHLLEKPKKGIPDATKEVVRTLVCQGLNAKEIKEQLREKPRLLGMIVKNGDE